MNHCAFQRRFTLGGFRPSACVAEIKTIANRQSAIFCVLVDKRVLKILEKSKG